MDAELEDSRSRSASSSKHNDIENGISACDACYSRKIKCDRRHPCGNCQDSRVPCLRERQMQRRKPKESLAEKLTQTMNHMDERMAKMESAIISLTSSNSPVELPSGYLGHEPGSETGNSRKRKALPRAVTNVERSPRSNQPPSTWNTYAVEPVSTPQFSTTAAQTLIHKELSHGIKLNKEKREAFHSALRSLSDSLNSSSNELGASNLNPPPVLTNGTIDYSSIPSLEVVQWALKPSRRIDAFWSLPDGLPIIDRKTIVEMAMDVQDVNTRSNNPAIVVCVNSFVAHFLLESIMAKEGETGLEERIREQITAYFSTAQLALSQISILSAPSLQNLQALIFGALNAQEAGDTTGSWNISVAGCNICISLGLHRKSDALSKVSAVALPEARYCFLLCYINDKGLAMNLGRPPCIPDAHVEVNLREIAPPIPPTVRQAVQDYALELAIVQSYIIDLQLSKATLTPNDLNNRISNILQLMENIWKMIQEIPSQQPPTVLQDDLQFEYVMAKFSFFAIKTVLFHSCTHNNRSSNYAGPLLESARASIGEIKRMQHLTKTSPFSSYKLRSFAHWTILCYPFTSFFILFCNVISKGSRSDYQLMQEFVEYLSEIRKTSAPIDKLHKLCIPFCALASSILKSSSIDEVSQDINTMHSSKRQETRRTSFRQTSVVVDTQATHQSQGGYAPSIITDGETMHRDSIAPLSDQNTPFDIGDDEFFTQFMDAQPRLQWLDSDFTAFEHTWDYSGLNLGDDVSGFS